MKESNWCKKGRFKLKFAGFRMEFKVIQVALYFKCDSAIGEKSGESFSFEILNFEFQSEFQNFSQ